jgi:hypothetical protein
VKEAPGFRLSIQGLLVEKSVEAEINIAVRLKTGLTFWPVQRVMRRFRNGAEDGIWIYGVAASESQ